jgi:hypothetical protein
MKSIRNRICNYIAPSTDLKNKISILLLLTFLVYTGGNFIVFKYFQFKQKQEVKLFINNNPQSSLAIQFKFSLQDLKENEFGFEWEEEWKEFNYKGVMYDIIHSTINKDSIYILALNDNTETHLIDCYSKMEKQQNNKKNNATSELKFFESIFENASDDITKFTSDIRINHNSMYNIFFSMIVIGIVELPPQY